MVRYNWPLFFGLLAASVAVSVALSLLFNNWVFLGLILFLPFLPRGLRSKTKAEATPTCPTCGYVARAFDESYCPRDGIRLA